MLQDQYTWDANGNVAAIADQQEGLTSRSMGYDGLDRLTSASGIWGAGSYGYDALDNLRTSTVGGRTAVATLDGANRLSGLTVNGVTQGYGYDANGNLTARGSQGFSFDIGNRLTSAPGKASYAYDGHGRRTWVAYADGSWKLQVYGSSGKLLYTNHSSQGNTRHVYLGSRLIAEVSSLTGTSYSHTDALGSPVARTNSAGQLLGRTRYEPYGATAAGTNPTGVGFTGHVNDADTGLVYMQQRYYEPVAGRFLSVDPVTTDANGGSFNRYLYANGNPYRYVDPDGRQSLSDFRYFGSGHALSGGVKCEKDENCDEDLAKDEAQQRLREEDLLSESLLHGGKQDFIGDVGGGGGGRSSSGPPTATGNTGAALGGLPSSFSGQAIHAPRTIASISRIAFGSLPAAELAAVTSTLRHVANGTRPTGVLGKRWGHRFQNRDGELPGAQGADSPYREFRVAPTNGSSGAGTQRIVINGSTGEVYYTWTHYGDTGRPAFVQLR